MQVVYLHHIRALHAYIPINAFNYSCNCTSSHISERNRMPSITRIACRHQRPFTAQSGISEPPYQWADSVPKMSMWTVPKNVTNVPGACVAHASEASQQCRPSCGGGVDMSWEVARPPETVVNPGSVALVREGRTHPIPAKNVTGTVRGQ